jgi:hypothetical protein
VNLDRALRDLTKTVEKARAARARLKKELAKFSPAERASIKLLQERERQRDQIETERRERIEKLRRKADIVAVVGRRVSLRFDGRCSVGMCPFCDEKAPTLVVDPHNGYVRCFNTKCGIGGDVFKFVVLADGVDYETAIARVAEQFGESIPGRGLEDDPIKLIETKALVAELVARIRGTGDPNWAEKLHGMCDWLVERAQR